MLSVNEQFNDERMVNAREDVALAEHVLQLPAAYDVGHRQRLQSQVLIFELDEKHATERPFS